MKKESIYLFVSGIILIWGLLVSSFFPLLHFVLTWLIMLLVTILIIKFSKKIYFGIAFSFILIFLDNTFWRMSSNSGYDDLGRDLSFMSFFISSSIVCITWGIFLFNKIRKDLDISITQIVKSYFLFLVIAFVLSLIIYSVIYKAWFFP